MSLPAPTRPAQFSERTIHEFVYRTPSEATRAAYRRVVREFLAFMGHREPARVTPADVIRFRDKLAARAKPSTVVTKLAILRSFFDHLQTGGHVAYNPAAAKLVRPPRLADAPAGRALTTKEVGHLLAAPDRSRPEGARDYALMLLMLRLGLRLAEVTRLRSSNVTWQGGRWVLKCKIKGGREEAWPLPADVKQALDDYLRLDRARREAVNSGGPEASVFQPGSNNRTLVYDKPLSPRHVERIVARWADYAGVGRVTPHDLRRTIVTHLLDAGHTYRQVQMVTKHKDPKTVARYDRARENLEQNPVNDFKYEDG